MANTLEQLNNQKYDKQVESYEQRYGKIFESVAKSNSFHGSLSKNDMYNLGAQIDAYKKYESYVNENGGSAASLGALPRIALDLISASYALSIAPQLASMQTLEEQEGNVYFKKVFTHGYPLTAVNGLPSLPENRRMGRDGTYAEGATKTLEGAWKKWLDTQPRPATGENDTAFNEKVLRAKNFDATTFNALRGWQASPTGYMSERQWAIVAGGETANVIPNIAFNTRWNVPMKLALVDESGKLTEMVGVIAGPGQRPVFYGDIAVTVDVVNGNDLSLTIPAGYQGALVYDIDFEKQPDVPAIEYSLDSMPVSAEIFGVKEMLGTFKGFQFNKRFGKSASDEVLADLSGHMAMAESEKVIAAYVQAANRVQAEGGAPIVWETNAPVGVSEFEHRQSLLYKIMDASAAVNKRAGKGYVNKIIAGNFACSYLASLPGFRAASRTNLVGPHVFGTLENEGITIIRSNAVVADNEVILAYSSDTSPFESPVVCATYMPVFVTDTLPVANNPFQTQRAIAAWKAIKPVVHQFVQRMVIVEGEPVQADACVCITGHSHASSGSTNG